MPQRRRQIFLLTIVTAILGVLLVQPAQATPFGSDDSQLYSVGGDILDLAWSSDSALIALRTDNKVFLVNAGDGTISWSVRTLGTRITKGLCFTSDDAYVVVPAFDGRDGSTDTTQDIFMIIKTSDPNDVRDLPNSDRAIITANAQAIACDHKAKTIYSANYDGSIQTISEVHWNRLSQTGPIIQKTPDVRGNYNAIRVLRMVHNSGMLAIDKGAGYVLIVNPKSGQEISEFQGSQVMIGDMTFNPMTGTLFTSGSGVVVNTTTSPPKPANVIVGSHDPAQKELWNQWIASAKKYMLQDDPTKLVKAWEPLTGKLLREYGGTRIGVRSISVSPDGRYVAAIDGGPLPGITLFVWDEATGRLLEQRDYGHADAGHVAFSPDSHTLAVVIDSRIHLVPVTN